MADSSKTEKATPKKRRDERKKGNVFLSQDAVSVATLLASVFVLLLMADALVTQLGSFFSYCVAKCGEKAGSVEMLKEIGIQAVIVFGDRVLCGCCHICTDEISGKRGVAAPQIQQDQSYAGI